MNRLGVVVAVPDVVFVAVVVTSLRCRGNVQGTWNFGYNHRKLVSCV